MVVALLAGGTGGAKLAVGLRDLLHGTATEPASQPGQLHVIANTGDDIEIYGAHVSPDPDLITFRLAGVLDDRGFGIVGETHTEMDRRRSAGEEIWFELGDADLAVCRARAEALGEGKGLTQAHRIATAGYETGGARVLPMSDDPVRTVVATADGPRGLQQFLIQDRSRPSIDQVEFSGAQTARVATEAEAALGDADLIVIGPSNPVISIGAILAVPGVRQAISANAAPVIVVSPFVDGQIVKGPTEKFMIAAGVAADNSGIAALYDDGGLADAYIADRPIVGRPHHLANMLMDDAEGQRALAAEVLRYGTSLK
jgi:LPPG:FO 2-phospho-L-lactate transferase